MIGPVGTMYTGGEQVVILQTGFLISPGLQRCVNILGQVGSKSSSSPCFSASSQERGRHHLGRTK